ncbi:hypothetical protein EV13_0761 [Prochlorococcus sp. MIT 0702]|nr:hypothetical protein EV12_0281 [Prochlorococcus sp. MIT 0701]KGG29957.1 hypothetical protein EV13_0761 [Prochlorococcus sp. MIT 0702]KGG36959.1 hypothetical protein EV14_0169 [Prochlorococcus sp. MIT 0703]
MSRGSRREAPSKALALAGAFYFFDYLSTDYSTIIPVLSASGFIFPIPLEYLFWI